MYSEGFVLKTEGEYATVGVKRQTACDTCRAQCGGHCDKASTVETVVKNTLCAEVGDKVMLYTVTSTVMKFAFETFVMPIIMAIAGFVIPRLLNADVTLCGILSAVTFLMSFVIIWLKYRNRKSWENIEMYKILEKRK